MINLNVGLLREKEISKCIEKLFLIFDSRGVPNLLVSMTDSFAQEFIGFYLKFQLPK